MQFVTATVKNAAEHGITPAEADVKAVQITEENKNLLGTTVAGFYYVTMHKINQEVVPGSDHFGFDIELYSDTNMIRAAVGDWLIFHNRKYKIEIEWVGKDAFETKYDVPLALEPADPSAVVDEMVPEINDGAV